MFSNITRQIGSAYRNFTSGIQNLIIWLPVVWGDRQWDYTFFLRLNLKKLELMENYFKNNGVGRSDKRVAQEIALARMLTERLFKNEYSERYSEMSKSRLVLSGWTEDELSDAETTIYDDFFRSLKKGEEPPLLPPLCDIIRESWLRESEYAEERKRSDIQYLGRHIAKRIFRWWD